MHRHLFLLFMLLLPASITAGDLTETAELIVKISKINLAANGNLRIALFRGEHSWPKFKNALQTKIYPVNSRTTQIVFTDLPYADDYAIEIHHDENGNGKFDMRWLPYPRPKEGVGVSNNSFGFGHPDFSAARFSIDKTQTIIAIEMNY